MDERVLLWGLVVLVGALLFNNGFLGSVQELPKQSYFYSWEVVSVSGDAVVGSPRLESGQFFIEVVPKSSLMSDLEVRTPQAPAGLEDMQVGDVVFRSDVLTATLVGVRNVDNGRLREGSRLIFSVVIDEGALQVDLSDFPESVFFGEDVLLPVRVRSAFPLEVEAALFVKEENTLLLLEEGNEAVRFVTGNASLVEVPFVGDELSPEGVRVTVRPQVALRVGDGVSYVGGFVPLKESVLVLPRVVGKEDSSASVEEDTTVVQEQKAGLGEGALVVAFFVIAVIGLLVLRKNG